MRWWLYGGLAIVAAGSIVAVVIAIATVTGPRDLDRIQAALRLQTNCSHITVRRPSRAPIVKQWAGKTVQSADVQCDVPTSSQAPPQVIYAKFTNGSTLDSAVAASLPAGGYCRLGDAVMLSRLAGAPSTAFSDICQSLGGQLVIASGDIAWIM